MPVDSMKVLDEGAVRLTSIPRHSGTDPLDDMVSALGHAGCLVVTGLADRSARDSVVAELAADLETAPVETDDDPAAFSPGHTQRVTALVARSEQVREPVLHPIVTAICDHGTPSTRCASRSRAATYAASWLCDRSSRTSTEPSGWPSAGRIR